MAKKLEIVFSQYYRKGRIHDLIVLLKSLKVRIIFKQKFTHLLCCDKFTIDQFETIKFCNSSVFFYIRRVPFSDIGKTDISELLRVYCITLDESYIYYENQGYEEWRIHLILVLLLKKVDQKYRI